MEFFNDLVRYSYLNHAFWACILSGITCGIIGTYVVCRRLVFLSGGITHSSFGGLGIAFYLGINPILGAMVFAVLSALGIEWANDRGRIREDSAIGIIWSVGMALGVLFMSLRPGYTSGDLSNFLFGSIVTVTRTDVQALAVLTLVVIVGTLLWLRPVMYVAFDRDFARSQGIPTRLISYTMSALIAVTIVLSIRIMGIVLLISHRLYHFPQMQKVIFMDGGKTTVGTGRRSRRRRGEPRGTRPELQFRSFARCGHNIYPDRYAYFSKTANFARQKTPPRR